MKARFNFVKEALKWQYNWIGHGRRGRLCRWFPGPVCR